MDGIIVITCFFMTFRLKMALMGKLAVLTEIMISVAFSPESFTRAADLHFIWAFYSGLHRQSATCFPDFSVCLSRKKKISSSESSSSQ